MDREGECVRQRMGTIKSSLTESERVASGG